MVVRSHPRVLVVFYSRSGNTRRVAHAVAEELHADVEEIVDRRDRRGILGYLRSGRDAWRQRETSIDSPRADPRSYDLVIAGSPVWSGSLTPAMRTYLACYREALPEVAFFITHGGSSRERVFRQMAKVAGRVPLRTLAVREKELPGSDWVDRARGFARELGRMLELGTALPR
jgi:flavodoxin